MHSFTVQLRANNEELILNFPPSSIEQYDSVGKGLPSLGCCAAEALLNFSCHLKPGIDYTISNPHSYSSLKWQEIITVKGKNKIILALDLFLRKAELQFNLLSGGSHYDKKRLTAILNQMIIDLINDQGLINNDSLTLEPLVERTLDYAYKELKTESLLRNFHFHNQINSKVKHYLHHPFFQLLALCYEHQNLQLKEYDSKSLLQRFNVRRPDTLVPFLNNRYIKENLIPSFLLLTDDDLNKTIDFEKLVRIAILREPLDYKSSNSSKI